MPEQKKVFSPDASPEVKRDDKGKIIPQDTRDMFPTPKPIKKSANEPIDYGDMDAGDVPMPLGKDKGLAIKKAAYNLNNFMDIYSKLNKIAAMETPPSNYIDNMQSAHMKMGEFIKANNLDKKVQNIQAPAPAVQEPEEEQVTDINTVPNKVFMGEFGRFPRKFEGMPISEIDDYGLTRIHMYFNYGLIDDNRDLFHQHKDFYDNLTKILLEKNVIQELDGEILYPKDIEFYNLYENSQPVGTVGENNYPLDVEIVSKPHSRDLKKDKGGKYYYMWILKEIDTVNIIQFRDYLVGSAKDKKHDALSFEHEMMKLRSKNGASIEADIAHQSKYKGVMRTSIYNPIWIQKIDNIHGEIDKIVPDDKVNTPQNQEKIKDLLGKYNKQESVMKNKPSLQEHVQKLMNISNYKRVIK